MSGVQMAAGDVVKFEPTRALSRTARGALLARKAAPVLFALLVVTSVNLGEAGVPPSDRPIAGSVLRHWSGRIQPPRGFLSFCDLSPADCTAVAGTSVGVDGRMVWSDATAAVLREINAAVNRRMRAIAEASTGEDDWRADVAEGDCEDFVLTKRRRLIEAGWASSAVVIATVYLPTGDYHAVLLARTEGGDFVLDNLIDDVRPFNELGYRYVKVQSPEDPVVWYEAVN